MHTFRTRFAKEIVAEFLPPARKTKTTKVVIFCDGAPSVPSKKTLLTFWSNKGYWVFHPRYRGSWESGGSFLKKSPNLDVLDVISGLSTGFTDSFSKKKYKIKPQKIFLIGSSFGGPAVILASSDKRVTKAVAFCPVVDWSKLSKTEKPEQMRKFFDSGFGNAYRFNKADFNKLGKTNFYNPAQQIKKISGEKILLIQTKDDTIVPWKPVAQFSKHISSKIILVKSGGHLGSSALMKKHFYNQVSKFFKS